MFILENISQLGRFTDRDMGRIVGILVGYMGEGSLEIRERTKKVLIQLLDGARGEEVGKMIPPDILSKIRKVK